VDLIIETGAGPLPVEIKSAQTVNPMFFKGLNMFRKLEPRSPAAFLVMGASLRQGCSNCMIRGYSQLHELFHKLDAV
jgi:hypothetical protein